MENEWLEIAYINFSKAILHGRIQRGRDAHGVGIEEDVEIVLTEQEKAAVEALNYAHDREMRNLLRGFVATRSTED